MIKQLYDLSLQQTYYDRAAAHANQFCQFGKKVFSQSDEDGLTLEIISRLDLSAGTFMEFGVGNGLQNNTLVLLAMGWEGAWFGNEDLVIDVKRGSRLSYTKTWITAENVLATAQAELPRFGNGNVDLISLDLDGNDLYIVKKLLRSKLRPKVFIVEYNQKFPPPLRFCIPYDPNFSWTGDDFFGASLCSMNDAFVAEGYRAVCCNAWTGVNAFFIEEKYFHLFPDTPEKIEDIYSSPCLFLPVIRRQATSRRTVEMIINSQTP